MANCTMPVRELLFNDVGGEVKIWSATQKNITIPQIIPPRSYFIYPNPNVFHENSIFLTFIKNVYQWGMKTKIQPPNPLLGQYYLNPPQFSWPHVSIKRLLPNRCMFLCDEHVYYTCIYYNMSYTWISYTLGHRQTSRPHLGLRKSRRLAERGTEGIF